MRVLRLTVRAFPVAVVLLLACLAGFAATSRVERTVEATGEVRVHRYQVVRPRSAGFVAELLVEPGDTVTRGQPLVRLDDPEQWAERERTRGRLEGLLAELERTQGELDLLRHTLHPLEAERARGITQDRRIETELAASRRRQEELAAETLRSRRLQLEELDRHGLVSRNQLQELEQEIRGAEERLVARRLEERLAEQREAAAEREERQLAGERQRLLDRLKAERRRLRAEKDATQLDLARFSTLLDGHLLRASMAGVVIGEPRHDLLGRRVEAGTELFQVLDVASIHFVSDVPEQALVRVRPGQTVSVELRGLPKNHFASFAGEVRQIDRRPQPDATDGASYPVEIRLDKPWIALADGRYFLRGGMRGTARIAYRRGVPLSRVLLELLTGAAPLAEPISPASEDSLRAEDGIVPSSPVHRSAGPLPGGSHPMMPSSTAMRSTP